MFCLPVALASPSRICLLICFNVVCIVVALTGAGMVAYGIIGLVRHNRLVRRNEERLAITPAVGGRGAGVLLQGRF